MHFPCLLYKYTFDQVQKTVAQKKRKQTVQLGNSTGKPDHNLPNAGEEKVVVYMVYMEIYLKNKNAMQKEAFQVPEHGKTWLTGSNSQPALLQLLYYGKHEELSAGLCHSPVEKNIQLA